MYRGIPREERESSYYGDRFVKEIAIDRNPRRKREHLRVLIVAFLLIASALLAGTALMQPESKARIEAQTILAVPQIYQYKDTPMGCAPCAAGTPWHASPSAWNCTKYGGAMPGTDPGDNTYGTADDCPHCSTYCVPASILMIASYRGIASSEDQIADAGELRFPGVAGNNMLETHGWGMTDGVGGSPQEVQTAWAAVIGALTEHDQWNPPSALTIAQLMNYILKGHPVLWLDHNNWPANMSAGYPSNSKNEQGHAKVIIGYDDNDTANTSDDLCLINDPWPEYNDKGLLPVGATKGPGGTWDPYWYNATAILVDVNDIFIVDLFPDIPEFQDLMLPIAGCGLIALVAIRRKLGRPAP